MILKAIMEKYQSVYQMELLTDNTVKNVSFINRWDLSRQMKSDACLSYACEFLQRLSC